MASKLATPLEVTLGDLLRIHGLRIATAESCTGGLLADKITDVPGSSEYYLGGFVSYAYEAKVASLGVHWDTLHKFGAVSRETVIEMANGARNALGADIAVGITGIAGPGGGLPEKPVGTTWICVVANDYEHADVFYWAGSRRENKEYSALQAMRMLIEYLNKLIP